MRIIIYGADGVIGSQLANKLKSDTISKIVGEITPLNRRGLQDLSQFSQEADILIDFSHPNNLDDILRWGQKTRKALLLCTTGYDEEDREKIIKAGQYCPVLLAGNTSIGINIVKILLEQMVSFLGDWDIEIVEKHHNRKKDSPSGTAQELLRLIEINNVNPTKPVYGRSLGENKRQKGDVGIHSVRGGNIVGEHSIMFVEEDEVIEITHRALSRKIFISGAIHAARWLVGQPPGFYTMRDTFNL